MKALLNEATMPLTLTINTAEKRVQMLLSRGTELLHVTDMPSAQSGAELLTPALRDACAQLGVAVSSICRVASVAGPGGFTGLRLALTTAAGLARARQGHVQQAGLHYLQCLAANVAANVPAGMPAVMATVTSERHGMRAGRRVRVVVNARRGWLYWGDFEVQASGLPLPLTEAVLVSLPTHNEAETPHANPFAAQARPDFVLGSGLTHNRTWFEQYYDAETLLGPEYDHPTPAALLAMTQSAVWGDDDIAPLYLRDCDAVENLDHIARTHGQDPEQAHAELRRLLAADLTNVG